MNCHQTVHVRLETQDEEMIMIYPYKPPILRYGTAYCGLTSSETELAGSEFTTTTIRDKCLKGREFMSAVRIVLICALGMDLEMKTKNRKKEDDGVAYNHLTRIN
uniref:Uncharacterized protein n=1 Tax=Glossina pallidipes TaxID=7398 RepID=A0A1A9Z883_GLOPL